MEYEMTKTRQEQQPSDKTLHSIGMYLASLKLQSEKLDESLRQIAEADCSVGAVCAFSGNRLTQNHHLDWALVSLDEDVRACWKDTNTIPNATSQCHGQIRSPNLYEYVKSGLTVYKARHPGFTGGDANATKSYMRFRIGGQEDEAIETTEWAVVPQHGDQGFGEPGDCGVWVVSRISDVLVGVIYAMNAATGVSYVTPITEIFEDITKDTGYTVRLPGY
jgi:hypothetical protein